MKIHINSVIRDIVKHQRGELFTGAGGSCLKVFTLGLGLALLVNRTRETYCHKHVRRAQGHANVRGQTESFMHVLSPKDLLYLPGYQGVTVLLLGKVEMLF